MTNTITATRRRRGLLLAGTAAMAVIALTLSAYGLRTWLTARGVSSGPALWAWTPLAILLLAQTALYLCERPHRADAQGQEHLDGLHVAVLVPVFKEDNGYLRATLSSLLAQTRPPDSVHIADDGSEISHRAVRRWWAAASREHRIPTSWHRTPNRGKRHAQVLAARQCPRADVFVTVDSDAQLAPDALHEVLQPLADPRVQCAPAPSPLLLMAVPLLLTVGQTLRYLVLRRSDQPLRSQLGTWALSPWPCSGPGPSCAPCAGTAAPPAGRPAGAPARADRRRGPPRAHRYHPAGRHLTIGVEEVGQGCRAPFAFGPPSPEPLVGGGTRDARLRGDVRSRTTGADTVDEQLPAMNSQPGITVGHEGLRAVKIRHLHHIRGPSP